ncbi:glycogen synthase kinase binding protein [Leuresthes tenuis]|uniref:glycogen synthase kinase binding protein n=1 Tax=Leuresthes tenuis TaxID=355514 RepID=UPI003B510E35
MVRSTPRHPLFTNQTACWFVPSGVLRARSGPGFIHPGQHDTEPTRSRPGTDRMPCRKENYILLEQSVTVDPKEVDALVTKIGEALQLHNNSGGHQKTVSVSVSCLHGLSGGAVKAAAGGSTAAPAQRSCCMRLRSRGHRGSSRASPYHIPGSGSEQDWDHIKPWNRKRISVEEDDPHRLLQELLLSGNLIKEAVRRLQFSPDCGDFPRAVDNVPCS